MRPPEDFSFTGRVLVELHKTVFDTEVRNLRTFITNVQEDDGQIQSIRRINEAI